MVRRCWVNFQCRGVLLIWIIVGQGPVALAVGAGGGCLDIFSLICPFSPLSPSLWETARYRLKYCLKGPLNQKQPTNQPFWNILYCPYSKTSCIFGIPHHHTTSLHFHILLHYLCQRRTCETIYLFGNIVVQNDQSCLNFRFL